MTITLQESLRGLFYVVTRDPIMLIVCESQAYFPLSNLQSMRIA